MSRLGREGWHIAPIFIYVPGEGFIKETYSVPIGLTESECTYRVNSPEVIGILLELEKRRPGSMKKGLSWLAPYPEPPCWHQIAGIKMEHSRLGVTVRLQLENDHA